ncbi:HTH_48 domain-containing protein [Nephila pilipes]|uniref:HTH_48 domain-containing protein n=1 Tax=Nephila pilipes TaxID=299642 RepID=A0A8X6QAW2_NEPPI|nr:HTH_48 domain-containing protein [Nephila pilipes]
MRAVIRFLKTKRCNCTEIYRQLHAVYDENAMSFQTIVQWCNMFENRHTHIEDAESEGRQSTATNAEIAASVNECILANRLMKIKFNELNISHGGVHKIVGDYLQFHKVCARWVPRLLTE